MALPQTRREPSPLAASLSAARGRRCTYRRLSRVGVGGEAGYEVSCLYPDRRMPLPLGNLDASTRICGSCTATHIFRPDED
jgi:hypothetical protein